MSRLAVALACLALSACTPSGGAGPRVTPAAPAAEVAPLVADAVAEAGPDPAAVLELDELQDEPSAAPEPADFDLLLLSDSELVRRADEDLASLGSLSLGKPNGGALVNGVQMPVGERWELVSPFRAWGTREVIDGVARAIDKVHAQFGEAHPVSIGHISAEHGGRLWPHRSHQAGRDVDLGYYYLPGWDGWYRPATKRSLDVARSWALVRAFLVDCDVEMIFIDRSVQAMLKKHALAIGEDRRWLDAVFQYGGRGPSPIIRHVWGHRTHLHVRFYSPRAQQLGARLFHHVADKKLMGKRRGRLLSVPDVSIPERRLPPRRGGGPK